MPEDGPFKLDGDIVWFKNGAIHRSDGPAMELEKGGKGKLRNNMDNSCRDHRRRRGEIV